MHGPLRLTYALLANYMAKCQMSSGPYGPIFIGCDIFFSTGCFWSFLLFLATVSIPLVNQGSMYLCLLDIQIFCIGASESNADLISSENLLKLIFISSLFSIPFQSRFCNLRFINFNLLSFSLQLSNLRFVYNLCLS